ncbi:MAG: DUF4468 domain-containing protein [Mucilaginibacter sp.]
MLIIAFVFLAKSAFAQKDTVGLNVPYVNNTVIYERVFDAPNTTQNLLYSNAELWLAETHPYIANTQLTLADPALSRVVGRLNSSAGGSYKVLWETQYYTITYNFTLQVDCKDNKYRIRIYNIQDVLGDTYTPIEYLMQSLINSKSYNFANGAVLKTQDLKQRFQALNVIVNNVMAEINKNITEDNSF